MSGAGGRGEGGGPSGTAGGDRRVEGLRVRGILVVAGVVKVRVSRIAVENSGCVVLRETIDINSSETCKCHSVGFFATKSSNNLLTVAVSKIESC